MNQKSAFSFPIIHESPPSPSKLQINQMESESLSPSTASKETDHTIEPQQKEKRIQNKKRKQIHQNFILLKHKLNLKTFMRKTQIDSLLKKCKSKAFKSIHEAIKKCLKVKLPRLPQNFITNIKIDFNKTYINKKIIEIYQENNIIESFDYLINNNLIHSNKEYTLKVFLNLKLKEVIEYYINSKQYIRDYLHIYNREGEKFATLFDFIAHIFIQYYTKSKGNKPKQMKSLYNKKSDIEGPIFRIEKQKKELQQLKRKKK